MIFSKNVRRIIVTLGVASPFILSLGSASAHVVTAQHVQSAAHTAVTAWGGDDDEHKNKCKVVNSNGDDFDNFLEASGKNANIGCAIIAGDD